MSNIIINKLGFGFLNLENKTIFFPKEYIGKAKNGDEIEYEIIDNEKNVGKVTKVINERPLYCLVSHIWQGKYVLKDIDENSKEQYYINCNNYQLNRFDVVKLEQNTIIKNYGNYYSEGKINYIIDKYQLSDSKIDYKSSMISNNKIDRYDFKMLNTFTIDPVTSKDFDDAISINIEENYFILGIHIADVSHYIKPNTELDILARKNMNTIYLNGKTLHMLPNELSNDLCSLLPNKERKVVSVMIKYSKKGELINYEIKRSTIISKKRYTYNQVRNQINNNDMDENINNLYLAMNILYPNLKEEYNLPTANIILDENKIPLKVEIEPYDMAHKMIEKGMILANEIVSLNISKQNKSFPYRIHEDPINEKLEKYNQQIQLSSNPAYLEICKIKSYRNANYGIEKKGHYGLNLKSYCHFTSPIRRYIDIIVHRILLNEREYSDSELIEICQESNEKEQQSFKAEMELLEKQKQYLLDKDNNELQLLILDVNKNGVKCQIFKYMMEYYLHISRLDSQRLNFDKDNKILYNDKFSFKIGDIIYRNLNYNYRVDATL